MAITQIHLFFIQKNKSYIASFNKVGLINLKK